MPRPRGVAGDGATAGGAGGAGAGGATTGGSGRATVDCVVIEFVGASDATETSGGGTYGGISISFGGGGGGSSGGGASSFTFTASSGSTIFFTTEMAKPDTMA